MEYQMVSDRILDGISDGISGRISDEYQINIR